MFSPLEQFNVIILINLLDILDISLTSPLLTLIFLLIFLLFLIYFLNKYLYLIPIKIQFLLELLYVFILNILKQQTNIKGIIYFPFIFTLFNFVLCCNLLSLIPFGLALTSHLILILFLSLTICLGIFLIGLFTHSFSFFKLFIPNCPFILLPILIPIEIFSYIIRMFSLAIRLAANILAGHTLVYIIASFILTVIKKKLIFFLLLLIPLFAILALEFGVAFLQAFVFTILISIYLADSLKSPIH